MKAMYVSNKPSSIKCWFCGCRSRECAPVLASGSIWYGWPWNSHVMQSNVQW